MCDSLQEKKIIADSAMIQKRLISRKARPDNILNLTTCLEKKTASKKMH